VSTAYLLDEHSTPCCLQQDADSGKATAAAAGIKDLPSLDAMVAAIKEEVIDDDDDLEVRGLLGACSGHDMDMAWHGMVQGLVQGLACDGGCCACMPACRAAAGALLHTLCCSRLLCLCTCTAHLPLRGAP
jgi:hypothetical protein